MRLLGSSEEQARIKSLLSYKALCSCLTADISLITDIYIQDTDSAAATETGIVIESVLADRINLTLQDTSGEKRFHCSVRFSTGAGAVKTHINSLKNAIAAARTQMSAKPATEASPQTVTTSSEPEPVATVEADPKPAHVPKKRAPITVDLVKTVLAGEDRFGKRTR